MDISILTGSPLFAGFTEEEAEKILKQVHIKIRKYNAGSQIAQIGEKVTSLMLILDGITKGEMVDYTGRLIKIEDITAPGALAAAFLFGDRNHFPVNVAAVTNTKILIIEKSEFLRLLKTSDKLLLNFLNIISNRSQFLSEKIKFLNFKTIRGKLAQFVLQRTTMEKPSFKLGMTQTDLADYFGVARPSLSRALKELEDDRLIEAHGKTIRVTDRKRLAELTL